MDESVNKGGIAEAIFGIVIIFSVLIFLLYKFGTGTQNVDNYDQTQAQDYKAQLQDELNNPDADSDIYNKYLKEIYDNQKGSSTGQTTDDIITDYQRELQSRTTIPDQSVSLQNMSTTYDAKIYKQNFENLYTALKKNGATTENQIMIAQISSTTDTVMPLSNYDKQNFMRFASDYEIFADNLQKLNTPTKDAKVALEIAKSAMNISYILKQMAVEDDQKIYMLWITKYAQNISVIITLRYALH